jgi:hypothetical protein
MAARLRRNRATRAVQSSREAPDIRFAHLRLLIDALEAKVSTVEIKVDRLRAELQTLPSAVVEILDEREKRK